jgi:hypothetical protein
MTEQRITIRTLRVVVLRGVEHPAGAEVDADASDAAALIEAGAAEPVVARGVDTAERSVRGRSRDTRTARGGQ